MRIRCECNNGFIKRVCPVCDGNGKDPYPPANQSGCECDVCRVQV